MPEQKMDRGGRQDEINLLNLFIVLLKHKWLIISIVLGTALLTILYLNFSLRRSMKEQRTAAGLPPANIYYSDCLLRTEGIRADELVGLLKRRNFALKMIEDKKLMRLMEEAAPSAKQGPVEAAVPVSRDAYNWLDENLFVSSSQNLVTIGFTAAKADVPAAMIGEYLNSLSEYFRKRDIENFVNRRRLLVRQMETARDPFIKARISEHILKLMDSEAIARSAKYYGFDLLDAPSAGERVKVIRTGNEKRVEPVQKSPAVQEKGRRSKMVVVLMVMASFLVAVFVAFLREYIENLKASEPEKFEMLKKYLSIRHKEN